MKHISAILLCAMMPAGVLFAQSQPEDSTLNRTVVVENQYNPEVMDAYKVNVLPKIEEPAVAKKDIDYAMSVRPLVGWQSAPMELVSNGQVQDKALPGYVRLSYGNRNNTDIKLSYLWNMTDRDRLDVMGSFYGFSGNVASLNEGEWDWKSRFFRTDVSLGYGHRFDKVSLMLGGAFGSQVFNYMPYSASEPSSVLSSAVSQRYSMGEGYVGIASEENAFPLDFALQTGFRGFGYRHDTRFLPETSQHTVHTQGFVGGTINDDQRIDVAFVMDNVMYDAYWKDYTLLQLNPYYTYRTDELNLRLGAHVDWQSANGSGIKAAPDVKLDYTFADSYVVFVHAVGGARLNDFLGLNEITPYWMLYEPLRSTYTYLDATAGLKASPVTGLKFDLYGGYKFLKDEVFALPGVGDNYADLAGTGSSVPDALYTMLGQGDARVAYVGAGIGYGYRGLFDFSVAGQYNSWNPENGTDNFLMLKPQFTLDASADFKLLDGLHAGIAYQYEGRVKTDWAERLDPVNNLSVSATYSFLERLNVFVRFNNLLNKDYITSTGYPVQGFNVMAGISCRF